MKHIYSKIISKIDNMIEKEHSWQYVPYKRTYESTYRYIRG